MAAASDCEGSVANATPENKKASTGDQVNFECNSGYVNSENGNVNTFGVASVLRTCGSDGEYIGDATCVRTCGALTPHYMPTPAGAAHAYGGLHIVGYINGNPVDGDDYSKNDTTFTYSCSTGYVNSDNGSNSVLRKCGPDGKYTGDATCVLDCGSEQTAWEQECVCMDYVGTNGQTCQQRYDTWHSSCGSCNAN